MDGRKPFLLATMALALLSAAPARAATLELSGTLAYSKSSLVSGYRSEQRRYTGSADLKVTPGSSIQFEYAYSQSKFSNPANVGTNIAYITEQANTYVDKVYSVNWVQNLVPARWIIQPYVVLGGGKIQRRIREEIPEFGRASDVSQGTVTGTGGVGIRIFFLRNMAVKVEAKTYVPDFRFSRWKDNQMISSGLSWIL